MQKAGAQSKIEFYNLGERVVKLLFGKEPLSGKEISKLLKKEGYEIAPTAIYNFRTMVIRQSKEMLLKKPKYREKLAETFLDTVQNLVYALNQIQKKIVEFEDTKNWKAHATYLNLLLKECDQLLKRAGEIRPTVIKEMNIIEINQAVQYQISELIDNKDISLEHCSPKIKKFYKSAKKVRINANKDD